MVAPNARRLDGTVAEDIRFAHTALNKVSGGFGKIGCTLHIGSPSPFQVRLRFTVRRLYRPRARRRPRPRNCLGVPQAAHPPARYFGKWRRWDLWDSCDLCPIGPIGLVGPIRATPKTFEPKHDEIPRAVGLAKRIAH
jgi:hypothetical protein